MSTALLATKYFAPPRPDHAVLRPLLAQRLDDGLARKLTLVCAAAGFGKSTLISQWAHDCPYPSAWLQLDAQDRDPTRFLDYVVASLQALAPAVGTGIAALLHGSPPASAETVLTMLLNQLSGMPGKLVLVLDDYHLAASTAVNAALAFLIDHMPAQLHLVLASREEPDIALGRLRVQGQLTEIRQHDLRFAAGEANAFFNQGLDLGLTQPQVNALEARTEGWIAGLKLAALSLQQHTSPDTFIASFTGSHRFVQDYLVEEVLRQQPAHVQSFLLRTSVLDRMCGPLCDAVVQGSGGQDTLAQLEQANLFIVPLDGERRWYRYHHLFADLLRQRLLQQEPAEPLHQRASQWYEAHGLELEAFHQATAAKDLAAASVLIAGGGMPLYFRGEAAPVMHWLAAQPHTVLNTCPDLWIVFAWCTLMTGQYSQLEAKLTAAEAALCDASIGGASLETQGQIAVLQAWLAVSRNQVDAIQVHANHALACLGPDSRAERTAAHCAIGVAHLFRGEQEAASLAFTTVIDDSQSSGNRMFTVMASIAMAGIQVAHYELYQAAASYRDVIRMIADPTQLVGYEAHLGLARILYDWNALDEAATHAELSSQLSGRADSESGLGADVLRARLMLVRRQHAEADALLARTSASAKTKRFTGRMQEVADLQVRQLLRRGEVEAAAAMANAHPLPIAQARVLWARGEAREALQLVTKHAHDSQAKGLTQEALKALLVQAMLLSALGEADSALQVLRQAVARAEPQGSIRLFVDEGEPLHALLARLQPEPAAAPYIARLLAAFCASLSGELGVSGAAATAQPALPAEVFSPRELEILRLIQHGHSNQTISQNLFLSLSTVKWHNQNIFAKLGVQRRTEAVARALEMRLL